MLISRDDHGFTALHWACREGQMVIFEMLIARGGRVNGKNDGLDSPLHLACSHGRKDIVMKVSMKVRTHLVMFLLSRCWKFYLLVYLFFWGGGGVSIRFHLFALFTAH